MDSLPQYKLQRKSPHNPLPAPPYCRMFETETEEFESTKIKGLEVSDPGNILLLVESLFDNNTQDLEKKINNYVASETGAETVFIITLIGVSDEAVVQVVGQNVLETEFRTPIKNQIFMEAANRKSTVTKTMEEFDVALRMILNQVLSIEESKSYQIVTVPVFSKLKKGKRPGLPLLVCVINSPRPQEFITKIVTEAYRFCLPVIINTSKLEEEARIKRQCQSLLHVARRLFNHLDDLSDLLKEIMSEARRLTRAERCSLFLLDPDHIHLVAKVFDGMVYDDVNTEVKIAKDQGIAGHVAATGKLLNIRDAYSHPLFYKGLDEVTGFRTKNILCFPIRDEYGIVGVAQLCNKLQGDFDFFDEEIALAFSIYCGISIMHSLMYKRLMEAQNRSKLSNELMLYHMKVNIQDINRVLLCSHRHAYLDYDSFHFSPKRIKDVETPCHILRIFEDLKLFQTFRIKRPLLTRFTLYVKKGYRDTPYHNWMHAFSVTHFAYAAMKQLKLLDKEFLTPLEALAFVTSCMCHDIDHRGTTNSFQLQSGSLLANLYSSEGSVMEHHHLSQSMCILNTQDCNFLECLGNDEYMQCIGLIRDMILATDLANHFKLMKRQQEMVKVGFNPKLKDHKYVFLSLLMTCADLSDQIKNWEVIKVVANQIYNEFFRQGDMEKSMGKTPLAMMDREQASIPDLQLDFLTHICLPAFKTLSELFPEATDLVKTIERNMKCWEICKPIYNKIYQKGDKTSLEVLNSPEIDEEIKKILMKDGIKHGVQEEDDNDSVAGDKEDKISTASHTSKASRVTETSKASRVSATIKSSEVSEASEVSRSSQVFNPPNVARTADTNVTSKGTRASKGTLQIPEAFPSKETTIIEKNK